MQITATNLRSIDAELSSVLNCLAKLFVTHKFSSLKSTSEKDVSVD